MLKAKSACDAERTVTTTVPYYPLVIVYQVITLVAETHFNVRSPNRKFGIATIATYRDTVSRFATMRDVDKSYLANGEGILKGLRRIGAPNAFIVSEIWRCNVSEEKGVTVWSNSLTSPVVRSSMMPMGGP